MAQVLQLALQTTNVNTDDVTAKKETTVADRMRMAGKNIR